MATLSDLLVSYKTIVPEKTTTYNSNIEPFSSLYQNLLDFTDDTDEENYSISDNSFSWNTSGLSKQTFGISSDTGPENVVFKGKTVNLDDSVSIILNNLNKQPKHTCTRAVANALKGETNYKKASGVADPKAMYSQLKKDGWTEMSKINYTPQLGDICVSWNMGGKYGMHTSIYTNEKGFVSYALDNPKKDGQRPWFWDHRNDTNSDMHIMRYIGSNKFGGIIKHLPGLK